MSQSTKKLSQVYREQAQAKIGEALQHLKLLQRLLQSNAKNFFDTRQSFQGQAGLIISEVKLRKSHILPTNYDNKAFEGKIRGDLSQHLDGTFLSAFAELVEKRIILVRERQDFNEYQGQLLVLSKNGENSKGPHKTILLRLDYFIVHEKIEYHSLKDTLKELFLVAYTLSSIKKETFSDAEVFQLIDDGYQIFTRLPSSNQKISAQSLLNTVKESRELSVKENTTVYKSQQIKDLSYQKQNQQSVLHAENFFKNISLLIIRTTWADGSQHYGTACLYSDKAAITSSYNVTQRDGIQIKKIQICLQPESKIQWLQINTSKISSQQGFSVIILPVQLKRIPEVKVIDYTNQLPQYVNNIYVYGYQFTQKNQVLSFNKSFVFSGIKGKPSFDSYFNVKSNTSIGSLVLFVSKNQATVFGLYNPLNYGGLSFNLFHGSATDKIDLTIENILNIAVEAQVIIGTDDRIQVNPSKLKQLPYYAIGMIYAQTKVYDLRGRLLGSSAGQGTGTFITPNLIITCAHNVLGSYNQQGTLVGTYIATQLRFYPGFSSKTVNKNLDPIINNPSYPYYVIKSQDIYVTPSYQNSYLTNNVGRMNGDVAILHLKAYNYPASLSIRSVPKTDTQFWANNTLTICGYPGQTYGKLREHSGKGIVNDKELLRIQGEVGVENMLYYLIDTTGGNSGSAVMAKNKDNKYQIVAIHTQGFSSSRVGIVNSGPFLFGDNLTFVNEKLNTLARKIRSAGLNLLQFENLKFKK